MGCAAALAFVVLARAAASQTAAVDSARFHAVDYAVRIDLPDSGATINGDATLTLRHSRSRDTLVLDLIKLRVKSVSINGSKSRFTRTDSTIRIIIPRSVATVKVRVVYDGAVTDGLIVRHDSLGRWTYFGDNWPTRARYWIPSLDRPSEKATITWTVTAPVGHTIVANGKEVEKRELPMAQKRRVLSRWRETKPIAPYLMVIAAAPLIKVDLGETACGFAELARCVPQAVYVEPEALNVVPLPGAFSRAGDIVQFYASLIAPFPYEKLAHLQSETRFGGMENATAIFYADAFFRSGGAPEGIIAHETAHQWFGDAVTEKLWSHVWLSEGFATYFAALWTQHAHGDSAFLSEMSRIRSQILADTVSVPRRPVIDTIETDVLSLLNVNSYQKGGFVLHMLRTELGDSVFFAALRDYYTAHKHGNALTDDLEVAFERRTGRSWRSFFDQWLRRPGYPEVSFSWTSSPQGVFATVTQSKRFGYFDFTLPIVVIDRAGARHVTRASVSAQPMSFLKIGDAGTRVQSVLVDPDVTVLMQNTTRPAK